MIYKDTLFDTIPITAKSCIVEKETVDTVSARERIELTLVWILQQLSDSKRPINKMF